MSRGLALPLTVLVGSLIAIQAPVNSRLGKSIGSFPAAVVSFAVGLVLLVIVALIVNGVSSVHRASGLPWWAYIGGALGAAYVVTALVTVRPLGASGVTAATIAGQLTMAVVIDRFGLFGIAPHPLSAGRLAGVALLAAGVFLIVSD